MWVMIKAIVVDAEIALNGELEIRERIETILTITFL